MIPSKISSNVRVKLDRIINVYNNNNNKIKKVEIVKSLTVGLSICIIDLIFITCYQESISPGTTRSLNKHFHWNIIKR